MDFFKNMFKSKKKKTKPQNNPQINQMQSNRIPVQQNMYYQQTEHYDAPTRNYDLKNDKIPASKPVVSKNTPSPIIDPTKIITLKLRSNYKSLSAKDHKENHSKIPLLVTLETEDIEDEDLRQGLDLVLVIDISGSMQGNKIKLVRETLVFILDELEPKDRVCMIKFDSTATQITGFKSMTMENKEILKETVEREIKTRGSTDLKKAMDVAFKAMLSREEENDGTAVFLLSDGEDTCGNSQENIRQAILQGHKKMEERGFKYQTHSFGYGEDHDEAVLSMISDTTSGNFYFIKSDKYVDECFIDCFGFLMSVVASQVEVRVVLQGGFEFKHLFSISWKDSGKQQAILKIHGLAVGKTLDYITEIGFDPKTIPFEAGKNVIVAKAIMTFLYNDKKYEIEEEMNLNFVESDSEKGEPDPEVEESYSKAEGARVMEQARKLNEEGKKKLAEQELKDYHVHLGKKKGVSKNFKSKMSKTVKMDFIEHKKDYMQVNKMMCENAWNPAYEGFTSMNSKQKKMRSKKGY